MRRFSISTFFGFVIIGILCFSNSDALAHITGEDPCASKKQAYEDAKSDYHSALFDEEIAGAAVIVAIATGNAAAIVIALIIAAKATERALAMQKRKDRAARALRYCEGQHLWWHVERTLLSS